MVIKLWLKQEMVTETIEGISKIFIKRRPNGSIELILEKSNGLVTLRRDFRRHE